MNLPDLNGNNIKKCAKYDSTNKYNVNLMSNEYSKIYSKEIGHESFKTNLAH